MNEITIQTVKEIRDIETEELQGYLVDGVKHVPLAEGNRDYILIKQWIEAGNTPELVYTDEERQSYLDTKAKQEAETIKDETLSKLTVTLTDGKVFYADYESRLDLRDAIQLGLDLGQYTTYWKLAEEFNGQRIVEVTIDELKEASRLALQTKGQLVGAVE